MPHRILAINALDLILSLLPASLIGLFDFDPFIVAHMVGCYTGALVKWGYDVKIKKMDRQWATFYALISLGAGYIFGNSFVAHYTVNTPADQVLSFFVAGIGANYFIVALIKIFIWFENSSLNLTKGYIKNWLKNFLK